MNRSRALAASLGFGCWLALGVAWADDAADARAEYAAGAAALQKSAYRDAAEHFDVAAKLRPNATAYFAAAKAWQLAGELVRSADRFSSALEANTLTGADKAEAMRKLAGLQEKLGTVLLSGDRSMEAQVDDGTPAHPPASRHALPGRHVLLIRGNGTSTKQEVTLTAGGSLPFDLKPSMLVPAEATQPTTRPEPVPDRPVEPQTSGVTGLRVTSYVFLGIGVAGAGAAIGLGVAALGAKSTFLSGGHQAGDYNTAIDLQTATNVAWGAAGGAGGIGAVLLTISLLTRSRPAPPPVTGSAVWLGPAPGGAALLGRF